MYGSAMCRHTKYKKGIYAGVDCGTMSLRFMLLEVAENGEFKELHHGVINHGSAQELTHKDYISPKGIECLQKANASLITQIEAYGIDGAMGAAMGVLRSAQNKEEGLQALQGAIPYKVIDGIEELVLSVKGAAQYLNKIEGDYYFVDMGGSSTEIAIIQNKTEITHAHSFPVGLRHGMRTLEPYGDNITPCLMGEVIDQKKILLEKQVRLWPNLGKNAKIVITLPQLLRFHTQTTGSLKGLYGSEISKKEVEAVLEEYITLGEKGRKEHPLVDEVGVYASIPAVLGVIALLELFGLSRVVVVPSGISRGLALQAAQIASPK